MNDKRTIKEGKVMEEKEDAEKIKKINDFTRSEQEWDNE